MIVQLSFCDLFGCLHNQCASMIVEQSEIVVGLCSGPFNQTKCSNKQPRKPVTADGEVQDSALGRGPVKRRVGYMHFAHRVLLDSRNLGGHEEWMVEAG